MLNESLWCCCEPQESRRTSGKRTFIHLYIWPHFRSKVTRTPNFRKTAAAFHHKKFGRTVDNCGLNRKSVKVVLWIRHAAADAADVVSGNQSLSASAGDVVRVYGLIVDPCRRRPGPRAPHRRGSSSPTGPSAAPPLTTRTCPEALRRRPRLHTVGRNVKLPAKRNETETKQFWNSFVSVSFCCEDSFSPQQTVFSTSFSSWWIDGVNLKRPQFGTP